MDGGLVSYWRPIITALDPWRPMGREEVAALYVERKDRPSKRLATKLRIPEPAIDIKAVVCGARGSGKSTELTRLHRDLATDFAVVHVDVAPGLPEGAGTAAVLALLGAATLRLARDWTAPDADLVADAQSSAWQRFEAAAARMGAAAGAVGRLVEAAAPILTVFEPSAGSALAAIGATARSAGERVREAAALSTELTTGAFVGALPTDKFEAARELVGALNDALARLRELAGRQPLVLADGLDKRRTVQDVKTVFADAQLLRDVTAPIVLTGPIHLRHLPAFKGLAGDPVISVLPNVPVWTRRNGEVSENPEGISLLGDLFTRRRQALGLPEGVFTEEILHDAAAASSGIVREFLEILVWSAESAFERGHRTVDREDVDAAVRNLRIRIQGYLDEPALSTLNLVLRRGTLPGRENADVLLFQNIIACYENGDLWFRPHQTIVEWLRSLESAEGEAG